MNNSLVENESQSLHELLPVFYQKYHLGNDGGQTSPHVKIEFTRKIFLYFPNFDARRKAVFKHDVHHIATGYTSTIKGETEIGAWEIGSGCRHYWVAFILDLNGMMMGLLINPIGVYKAFIRGRQTKNLYADVYTDSQIMDIPLYKIRENLLLNNNPKRGKFKDILLFLLVIVTGVIYSVLSLLLLPFILIYTVYVMLKERN